jgi:hypothetical protein
MQLSEKDYNDLYNHAVYLQEKGYTRDMDFFQVLDVLEKNLIEKYEREAITDSHIDYNDEIVSIVEVGEQETIDITVSGDNLFLCNNILTKNSMGIVHSLDIYFALIRTEELDELNQVLVKQLKNRYGDPSHYKRFVIGLDASRMKFYDVEQTAQKNISDSGQSNDDEDDTPLFDRSRGKSARKVNTEGVLF